MKYWFLVERGLSEMTGGLPPAIVGYAPGQLLRLAYKGTLPDMSNITALEVLFRVFNVDKPADYIGRSMSVSDVIILQKGQDIPQAYACAAFGFENIKMTAELYELCVSSASIDAQCHICQKRYVFNVSADALVRLAQGMPIQNALPMLTDAERELFISGICGKCWNETVKQ